MTDHNTPPAPAGVVTSTTETGMGRDTKARRAAPRANVTGPPESPPGPPVTASSFTAPPFRPHPLFRFGHAQTLAAYLWPRRRTMGARALRVNLRTCGDRKSVV